MLNSDRDLDISLNSHVAKSTSRHYSPLVTELSSGQSPAASIFTEATAQAVRLTDAPVAILTTIAGSSYQISSICGLERFTLPIHPNLRLELAGLEYCQDRAIIAQSGFSVNDCRKHPQLARSSLYQVHGIRAYLGLPIITAARDRLGTIAILDFKPRQFSDRDIDLLRLVSRLVASEFERKLLSQAQLNRWMDDLQARSVSGFDDPIAALEHGNPSVPNPHASHAQTAHPPHHHKSPAPVSIPAPANDPTSADLQVQSDIQFKLLTHLAQELRTPLTSVLGMASVLQQEIYGSLSSKQKDYLGIIHHSSRQLVTLVDEISQLGSCDFQQRQLMLKSVDLDMLCQLAIQSLEALAQKKQQQIVLNLAGDGLPSSTARWLLDRDKVRQIVYYLCLSLIDASECDRQISISLTNFTEGLQLEIATNDPQVILQNRDLEQIAALPLSIAGISPQERQRSYSTNTNLGQLHISLGLSLSHSLARSHGGTIQVMANGLGYQLTLPLIITPLA